LDKLEKNVGGVTSSLRRPCYRVATRRGLR